MKIPLLEIYALKVDATDCFPLSFKCHSRMLNCYLNLLSKKVVEFVQFNGYVWHQSIV